MGPNTKSKSHLHEGTEEFFIIEGDLTDPDGYIYKKGDFNVAHTWQDWCNVYGGIAALLAGVDRVIMSGRTLPPEMKAILQARSGRSYKEAYKIILNLPGVEMIHNSNSGRAWNV